MVMPFPNLSHEEKSATLPLRRPSRVRFTEEQSTGSFNSSFEHETDSRERRGGNSGDFGRMPTLEEGDTLTKSPLKPKKSFIAKLGFVSKKKAADTALVLPKSIRPKGSLKHVNLVASTQSLQLTSLRRQISQDNVASAGVRNRPYSESVDPVHGFPMPQQPAFALDADDSKSKSTSRRSMSDPARPNVALRHQPRILDTLEEGDEQKQTVNQHHPIVPSSLIHEDLDESKAGSLKHSNSLPPPPVQIRAPKLSAASASLDNLVAEVWILSVICDFIDYSHTEWPPVQVHVPGMQAARSCCRG